MNTNPEWKLVPIEPTAEMLDAARRAPMPRVLLDSQIGQENLDTGTRYRAMLSAAPEAPPLTVTVDPDARGVSVGVYQGSRCLYSGAHPIPASTVATEGERNERVSVRDACLNALMAMGRAGANADVSHPLRQAWEGCRAALNDPASMFVMDDAMRSFIEGMEVSVDVSTGDDDAGHRLFGTIAEVMDNPSSKHGVILLMHDQEPNFAAPAAGDALDAARYRLAVSDCILLLRGDAALGRAEWDSKLDKLAKTKGAK